MINEYLKAAVEARNSSIEAAIHRFRECGVEIERFSIETRASEPGVTHLCVDGISRFNFRIVCGDHTIPTPRF